MKSRLSAVVAAFATALVLAGSAVAFDCIRVSSSWQGLQQSTMWGNWLALNMSRASGVTATFLSVVGATLPPEVAACVATQYASYHVTPYFALGIGVAGGNAENGVGVLVWHNKNDAVLGNLHGIDHLEDSPVGAALFGSLGACGIDVEED